MTNRSWIFLTLTLTLSGFLFLASFNFVVDPYRRNNMFPLSFVKFKLATDERMKKFDYLVNHPEVDTLIFGSSRGAVLDPTVLDNLTGGRSFNASFTSSTIEEFYDYIRYFENRLPLKRIVIGLDLFSFSGNFKPKIPLPRPLEGKKVDVSVLLNEYFSFMTFIDSFKVMFFNLLGREMRENPYISKGMRYYKEYIECKKKSTCFEEYKNKKIKNGKFYWHTQSLSAERIAILKKIKILCNSRNIDLVIFTSPLLADQILMKKSKMGMQLELVQTVVKNNSPVWDFNGLGPVNFEYSNFINTFHYNYKVGRMIFYRIFGDLKITGKNTLFGTLVTKSNVDSYIASVNFKLKHWQNDYAYN